MSKSVPVLESQLCFALYSASRAVARAYGPILEPLGLTYPQYLTMLAVWEARSPMSVSELGEHLRLDGGTLTPLLKRLEAAGLVTRQRDTIDERRVLISVTPAGNKLKRRAATVQDEIVKHYQTDLGVLATIKDQLLTIAELIDTYPETDTG